MSIDEIMKEKWEIVLDSEDGPGDSVREFYRVGPAVVYFNRKSKTSHDWAFVYANLIAHIPEMLSTMTWMRVLEIEIEQGLIHFDDLEMMLRSIVPDRNGVDNERD